MFNPAQHRAARVGNSPSLSMEIMIYVTCYSSNGCNTFLYEVTIIATHFGGNLGILSKQGWMHYNTACQTARAWHKGKLPPANAVIASGATGEL